MGVIKGTGTGPKPPIRRQELTLGRPKSRGLGRQVGTRLLTSSSVVIWRGPRKLGPDPSNTFYSFLLWHLSLVVALLGQRSHGSFLPNSKRTPQTTRGGRQRCRTGWRKGAGELAAPCLTQTLVMLGCRCWLITSCLSLLSLSVSLPFPSLFLSIFPLSPLPHLD